MDLYFGGLSAYVAIMIVVFCCACDRFVWVRGRLVISKIEQHASENGMIRFALHYRIPLLPMWSEIRYSLVDRNNPTTVISGKTRGLDFSRRGANAEFLLFKQDIVKGGDWDLKIKVVTMAGRLNPLYSLFPVQTYFTKSVRICK